MPDVLCHIADLHFWKVVTNPLRLLNKRFLGNLNVWLRRRHEYKMEHAEAFADAVAATGNRRLLLTGDFSSTSLDEEFERAAKFVEGLRARGLAIHLVAGNHDVYTFEAQRAGRFEQYFARYLPAAGYPACVTLPGGTPLLLIPTAQPNWITARGFVSPETVDRVRALLAACAPETPAIAAAHYPLLPRTEAYASSWQHRLGGAESLRALLGGSGRRVLFVAGHVHRFSYVRDAEFPNLTHLTTGAFFRRIEGAEYDGEFSEIHVDDGGFAVLRHRHAESWIREAAALS